MSQDPGDDGFKWFGEGFDGFPKLLPENSVEYAIYIINPTLTTESQIRERLRDIEKASADLSKALLKDYIWQREGFQLNLSRGLGPRAPSNINSPGISNKPTVSWVLRGRTNYGDSVADEWLIVYLLREISKQFPDSWIRVYDTDGEFLLIEAAKTLPRWLNPEVAEHRVWIHNGRLVIIPLESHPEQKGRSNSNSITLSEAFDFLSSHAIELIDSPLIEEEAFYRIRNYPDEISSSLHNALVTIPRKLAFILHHNPSYISPAIEAFYLRDPISMRVLQKSSPSSLQFLPIDLVTISTRFTKVGYAQLMSQEFAVPSFWKNFLSQESESKTSGIKEIGMKTTCAFEMMVADPQNQDKKSVREILLLLEDIENGDESLPTDQEILTWGQRQDDEEWLNINFENFEQELAGRGKSSSHDSSYEGGPKKDGFGDKSAQENLRKMVARFEAFLNDDNAGLEGAELSDDMDEDDEYESDSSSEGEDKEVSFDEEAFAQLMREMMGMPPEGKIDQTLGSPVTGSPMNGNSREDEEDEEKGIEEIHNVMARMEAELNESGALDLYPTPRNKKAINNKGKAARISTEKSDQDDEGEEDSNSEVKIDFNLAKNLLESLKSQAGTAGPAGNLIGLMGVKLPRDTEDEK